MTKPIIPIVPEQLVADPSKGDGMGCHAGEKQMMAAAKSAGKGEVLQRYAQDYPKGPHDQPQSMCPAFGSLRVGLRMRRTATILSGSACCVYGLTFTSHFYGARRSVGYVPFNSESLVTGKLFEDIRDSVHEQADPEKYDAIVIINLCVPTASGVPLQLLPKEINGVRIIGIDVPGFGVEPMGLAVGATVPTREWRELYQALDCKVVAAIHPFYTASIREFEAAGRPIVGSAPVGYEGTAAWLEAIGKATNTPQEKINAAKHKILPAIKAVLGATPIKGRITLSGYEGSELLVARLLIESGADVRYVGSACPRTVWSDADRQWLEAKGVQVQFRASLEQDLAAMAEFQPDLAIGTTPVVQAAKQASIPSLYFTNLISARPLMGPAGAGSLAQVINAAIGNQARFDEMKAFFGDVGAAHNAGVWESIPKDRPEFKAETRRKLEKAIKKRKAEEMI